MTVRSETMMFGLPLAIIVTNEQWLTPTPVLPRPTYAQIMGVWNDEIFLFSGMSPSVHARQLVKFTVDDENFEDYGTSALNVYNQPWFGEVHGQIQNLLYLPNKGQEITKIYIFDLSSNTVNATLSSITVPSTSNNVYGCLAAITDNNTDYLLLVGGLLGGTVLFNVQRYHIQNSFWDNITSMNTARYDHSCIIDQDKYLWAIGGVNSTASSSALSSIERVLITSDGASWQYNHQSLSKGNRNCRSVLYEDKIYVIGGRDDNLDFLDYVTIINTQTGNVSIMSDKLNYYVLSAGAVLTDHSIYIFGGANVSSTLSKWSKYEFAPVYPTGSPSISPVPNNDNSDLGIILVAVICIVVILLVGLFIYWAKGHCHRKEKLHNNRNEMYSRSELVSSSGPGRIM